jgi:pimeloyl-ACP methyl ester carboxylesterase
MSATVIRTRHPTMAVWCIALAVVLAGCQSGSSDPTPSGTAAPASAAANHGLGEAFDVGGHRLYLACSGTGSPTIVFESGLDTSQGTWWTVFDSFPTVRTCAYTLLNLPPSDHAADAPEHTGADSVRDLHTLLDVAAVPGPYLLVGHSFGGLLALMYAGTYPADLVGLVLVDPTLPADDEIYKQVFPESERPTLMAQAAASRERVDFFATLEQAKPLVRKVPNVPVVLLGSTREVVPPGWSVEQAERVYAAFRKAQQRFVDALAQGELRWVDTGHFIHKEAPQLVIDEVQRVLDKTH